MNHTPFLNLLKSGKKITLNSPLHQYMHMASQEAMEITMELNQKYHTHEQIRELMMLLTEHTIDQSFVLFPPFYTDFGKNIHIGKNVFINSGCRFQDHGGIYIDDHVLIGHNVVLATLNHDEDPEHRADMFPKSIHIEKNVWIGAHATVLPNVTIGQNSIVGAGAVVTKDVPPDTIVAGVPAKIIRSIHKKNTSK